MADSADVAQTARVGPDPEVSGYARVLDDTQIARGGVVRGYAVVADKAAVTDSAVVRGHARVSGDALIRDDAFVEENATVCGTRVKGHAEVCGKARAWGPVENRSVVCETGVVDSDELYDGVEVVRAVFGQARECHHHHCD